MKNPLWLEVSAAGGSPPRSSTFSDTISPHSPSCSCPSPDWLSFLDWNILNKHLLQDLQISCSPAKMHCPRCAHGPSSVILEVSVLIAPCSQVLPKRTWKITLPFDSVHHTSFLFLHTTHHQLPCYIIFAGLYSWTIKKAEHRRIDAFELRCWRRLLRVPWTTRRSNQSILKEISPIFIGRTDAEAETPILWPPDSKNWFIGKDPDAWKDLRQEKGTREDEMVGWHHWLDGHEFEQALEAGDGQGSLACCSPWSHKKSDMTEQLN